MPSDKESSPELPSSINNSKSPIKVRKYGSVHQRHNNVDSSPENQGGKKSGSPGHQPCDQKKLTSSNGTHRSHRPHRSKTSEGNADLKEANNKPEKTTKADESKKTEVSIEEKKPEATGCCGGLGMLYDFADEVDIQLMVVGTFLALVQSALPPFVWFVMGDFVSFAIEREAVKQNKTNELDILARHGKVFSTLEEFENSTTGLAFTQKQIEVDAKFEGTATPVFVAMLSMSIATFLAAFFQRLTFEWSGIRQVFRVKKAYIKKLLNMDVAWLESRHSGQVASMLHDHADSIYHGIADHLPMVIFILSYLIVSLSVCFYIQWDVTLVMFSTLPLLILTRVMFSKWFCKTLDEEVNLQNKMANLLTETFSCIRTVIAFSAQRQTINKYERIANEHGRITEERLRASSVYDALAQVLLTELIFTVALCYGMWRVGNDNPGRLAALAINMLYMCVTSISIGFHWNGISNARQNAAEMRSILMERPLIESDKNVDTEIMKRAKNTEDMWNLNIKNGSTAKIGPYEGGDSKDHSKVYKAVPKGQGTIRFNNVYFSYPSRPDIGVLKGVSLDIKQGENVAIVGSSGSGKSTLTALILRFYDPTKGNVHLDDEDLRLMNPDAIRAEIGLVSQEPVLFDGTISDNIRYGKLDATQADVNDAARKAEAWQFISALPEGMKTRVGDRGLQLSGGQKQRVAIARAVIRNPSVIIFDEATSALDTKHEGEVQKAIDAASQGVTTITIAHRLSTVKNSNRIIVLEAGEIVEEGPPDQLMSNPNGRFWRMYADQRLDSVPISTMHLSTHTTGGKLKGKFSMGPTDLPKQLLDPESRRRAWARSSLGANKRLGKSYSVLSTDRQKLTLPVMSKKHSRLDKSFKTNLMEVAVEEKSFDEDYALPGKATNLSAVWRLINSFKEGYIYLAAAIPITIFRGLFFLLVCFEVASVLEIAMAPDTQITQQVFIVAAVYTALIIIKTMFEAVGRLFVALYGHGFCDHMRGQMFRKLLRHGAAYFDEEQNTPGKLVHKVVTDTASLNRILGDKLDLLLPAVICSCVSVSIALWINWKLALFCGFQFPAFFIFRLVELRETSKRQRQMIEEEKKAANLATVVLSNMSTIKAYTLQEHFDAIFYNALKPLQSAMKRQSCISAFVFACQFSFTYILIAITLHIGKVMMLSNEITPFDYLRVVLLTQFGANFISQLIASVSDLTRARIAAENILAVINEPLTDMDNLTDEGLRPRVVGRIALQNVEFRYPSRPIIPILKNLTIQVAPGQSIAIVGPSGCGKSSVIAMFHRMYTPTSGQVLVDNYNVRSINPNYLRRIVVSVGQEPTLFSFTIKENITYGLCDDEFNMEKIIKAAKIAHIHDFISSLPNGYETEVGEFGAQLSGGQKQRIAIARAMVRDPKVLLLDEATAALDATSEKAVQEALESASRHCTCIHVAHRLSSIRTVDTIIVLVEGEIAEQGTHQELMEAKGLYYEMNQLEL